MITLSSGDGFWLKVEISSLTYDSKENIPKRFDLGSERQAKYT